MLTSPCPALGIQYATDIADYYNSPHNALHRPVGTLPKKVTLLHSRDRFLPLYDDVVDAEVKRRLNILGVNVILGDRVSIPSDAELAAQESSGEMRTVVTEKKKELEFDLLVSRSLVLNHAQCRSN